MLFRNLSGNSAESVHVSITVVEVLSRNGTVAGMPSAGDGKDEGLAAEADQSVEISVPMPQLNSTTDEVTLNFRATAEYGTPRELVLFLVSPLSGGRAKFRRTATGSLKCDRDSEGD